MPSIVNVATWKTGLKNCSTDWRWTARAARGFGCAPAHISTVRERLLKLAGWVERSVRRMVRHVPRTVPWSTTWQRVAVAVGAVPG
jgi:hypothetical protein